MADAPSFDTPPGAVDQMTAARAEGYDWNDIGTHLGRATSAAADEGYTQDEIDKHLGYETSGFHGNAKQLATAEFSSNPDMLPAIGAGDPKLDLGTPQMRGQYANALMDGTVKGPGDFANGYAAAALDAAHSIFGLDSSNPDMVRSRQAAAQTSADDIASGLPGAPDLIDAALHLSMGDPEPAPFLMRNLLDHWQDTGQHPVSAALAAETNPDLQNKLTTPPMTGDPEAAMAAETSKAMMPAINAWFAGNFEDWRQSILQQDDQYTTMVKDAMRKVGSKDALDPRVLAQVAQDPRGIETAANIAMATTTNPLDRVGRVRVVDFAAKGEDAVKDAAEAFKPTELAPMVKPIEFREGTAEGPDLIEPTASPAQKLNRIIQLEQERMNEDINIGTGTYFQDLAAQAEKDGVLQADPAVTELAEGYDKANGLRQFLGSLMGDERGAMPLPPLKTPLQAARAAADIRGRDYMRDLLVKQNELPHQEFAHWADILEPSWRAISPHLKEWESELAKGPAGNPMGTRIGEMLNYIEGRSAGVTLAADHPLFPVANAIRDAEQAIDSKLRQQAHDGVISYEGYVQDHIRHWWTDPSAAERAFLGTGKLGTRSGLMERKFPTYADGIAKGLQPKFTNPLEGVLADLRGKIFYSHAADMLDIARKDGRLSWSTSAPGIGQASIEHSIGRMAIPMEAKVGDRAAAVQARASRNAEVAQIRADVKAGTKTQAVAQAEIAAARAKYNPIVEKGDAGATIQTLQGNEGLVRQVNNWLSRGLQANPTSGAIADKLMYAKNVSTGFKLIWPAFHATVEGIGSLASGFGQGMEEVARGQFLRGVGNIASSALIAPNVFQNAAAGIAARRAYVRMAGDPIVQMLTEAGLRFSNPRAASLEAMGNTPGIFTSIARRSLMRELGQDVRAIGGNAQTETNAYRALRIPDRTVQFGLREVGRLMTTITEPFFDHAIPALKAGAAYRRMQSFLEANPTASEEVRAKYASQVAKDVDNRMGELNFDTVFWPQAAKQSLNIATISASWAYGSYRGFAAALGLNIDKMAMEWNPVATSSLIGTAVAYGYGNMLMQYFHTGQFPWQTDTPFKDLMNYRTGARTAGGAPERGMIPSELKEVYDLAKVAMYAIGQPSAAFQGLTSYALAKTNPWWQGIHALMTGEDAIGHKIANTPGGWSHYLKENFTPIFWEQWEQRRKGTGISQAETIAGFHEAAKYIEDPAAYLKGMEGVRAKWTKDELRRAQRENAALENPDPSIAAPTTGRVGSPSAGHGGFERGLSAARSGFGGNAGSMGYERSGTPGSSTVFRGDGVQTGIAPPSRATSSFQRGAGGNRLYNSRLRGARQ